MTQLTFGMKIWIASYVKSVFMDDPCVYVKGKASQITIMMIYVVYVDDFIIAAPTDQEIKSFVDQLRQFYDMKDLGKPNST